MGRHVVITGAGGGLGGSVVEAFAARGDSLTLVASPGKGEALGRRVPGARVVEADLRDAGATREVIEAAHARAPIDVLLCLAGGFGMQPAARATPDDAARQFGINFDTLFNTVTPAIRLMTERGEGLVVGTSAGAADGGAGGMALYAASKAAVAAWLRSLADELAGTGVRVTTLVPMGAIDTPGNRSAMPDTDPSTWLDPSAIAAHLVALADAGRRGHQRILRLYAEPSATG